VVVHYGWTQTDHGDEMADHAHTIGLLVKEIVARVVLDASFLGETEAGKRRIIDFQPVLVETHVMPLASLVGDAGFVDDASARGEILKLRFGQQSGSIRRLDVSGHSIDLAIGVRACGCFLGGGPPFLHRRRHGSRHGHGVDNLRCSTTMYYDTLVSCVNRWTFQRGKSE